ncbi:hypothetical protein [Nocardia neocaledoniensis]|uniref:hypothetical protein n=1 Tax=Nocardia neocaledoniensis TaxID=236511 RepID=UPI0024556E7B|nr:hypothetical protein [Nocardia neocaledoniensis]
MAGLVCISLPYTVVAARDAWWLIVAPLVVGGAFVAIGNAIGGGWSTSLRRTGVGLIVAFTGFVVAIVGVLLTIAIVAIFRH